VERKEVGEVRLEPFARERDTGLLSSWLRAPHVARWWGEPGQALLEALEEPVGGGAAVIVVDELPVGFVRWQIPARAELDAAGLYDIPDSVVDIDILVGREDFRGLGVGPRALRRLVDAIAADGTAPMIMLATSVENASAIGAYVKAGFERRRRFTDTGGGEYWLFALDVPDRL
jgi:aminoglycoside 6'-N-acetyltransferase